jgi:CHAT domain-containing protein/tetratricopeptide (TPR) repeat protein
MGKRSTLSSFCCKAPKKHSSIALRTSAARPRRIAARFLAVATLVLLVCIPSSAQEARWKELFAQAGQLKQQGKPVQALPIAQEAERVAEATFGLQNANTLASINRLATIYDDLGRYSEAEPLYKRAIGVGIKTLGPESEGIGAMLNNLAALNEETERYADSERFYKGALAINLKNFGPENPAVAINLNNLGLLYTMQARFAEAEPLYRRALAIDQKAYGDENPHVAINLNNLGLMYTQEAHYAEAEPLFKQALAIDQKSGINSSAIATDIHNLAALYELEGHQSQSEDLYKRALTIYEKQLGPDHPNVADTLGRLSQLYSDQGLYGDAEPPLKRSLAIYQKVFGQENLTVATSMSDLGLLYVYQGRGPEAEPLLKQSLAIREKTLGPDHPQLASAMYRVAYLYEAESRDSEAEPLLKRALAIHVKELGEESRPVGADVSLLGVVCSHEGRNSEAETYLKRAVEVVSKSIGPETREMASTLTDLAGLYQGEGKYADAEPLYKRAQTIFEKVLGAGQPEVYTNLFNLTGVYEAMGRHDEANSYMERGLSLIRRRFEYNFSYMSEKDRLQFLASVHGVFPAYFSFAVARHDHDPAAAGKMFDLVLWEKGIVGTSVSALRARVAASGDSEAVKLMDDLTAKKSESAQLATSRPPGWVELQSKLDAEANELEQQLARHVSGVGEQKNLAGATWQDVQKSLKPGDAAVEIVRYQFHDGKNWTNNYRYAALVVTPRASSPSLIVLGDAKKLESTPISNYRTNVALTRGVSAEPAPGEASTPGSGAGDTTAAYDAFWKPLEPALAGVKRVYVSPDGVLNQIPISLFADSSGKMLLEKYELRYVNSTKDLLRPPSASSSKSAVLLGNPKFDLTEPEERAVLAQLNVTGGKPSPIASLTPAPVAPVSPSPAASGQRSAGLRGGALIPLPGTQVEVDAIDKLLKDSGWQVTPYTGDHALEEVVERLRNPRVVHFATHGFFLTDQDLTQKSQGSSSSGGGVTLQDPMLRSGLFFAGANRVETGGAPIAGIEDGVLTAYQVSQLNLQGTELVVLSACETGLGEQSNSEGVFGLRRGLQEAGADAVMMSMWSVPDRETQELMALFYAKWLSGLDKPEALRQAQLKEREVVRQRYNKDFPFYWGAFVLISR